MKTAEEILKSKLDGKITFVNNPDYTFNKVIEAMEEYLQQYTTSHASHLTSSVEIIAEKHADKLYDKNAKTQIMVMECDLWHLRKNNFKDGVLSSSHPSPMSAEEIENNLMRYGSDEPNEYRAWHLGIIDGLSAATSKPPMSAEQVEELAEKYADSKYDQAIHLIGWSNTKHGFIAGYKAATTPSVKADGLETVKVLWSTLTDEQRLELACCKGCGSLDTSCQCLNDE